MSKYRVIPAITGLAHIDQSTPSDDLRKLGHGTVINAVDPFWGGGEFMYVLFSSTVSAKALCSVLPVYNATTGRWDFVAAEATSTANAGVMLGVAVMPAVSGNSGWIQVGGLTPVKSNAAVAAGTTFAVAATGQGGALAAGKQVLNAQVVGASTTTRVTAGTGVSGQFTFKVSSTDGVFIGAYVSGTGVGAAAIVSAINMDERTVTVTVANSADVSGNVTFTYNNGTIFYNVALLNRPFAQGAIT